MSNPNGLPGSPASLLAHMLGLARPLLAPPAAPPATPLAQWNALPGGVLELGTSGFQIRLRTDPRLTPYMLTDPDGREIVHGFDFPGMKSIAENQARWRAEFACGVNAWSKPR